MFTVSYKGPRREFSAPLDSASTEARNAAGEAVVTRLQDHFLNRNTKPNARNWPKRGFWADVLKSVGTNISSASYAVTVASPSFWRRWKGGEPIKAKASKRLAIPAIAEAYVAGRPSAGRVPVALTIIFRKRAGKPPAVALAEYTERPDKNDPTRKVKVPGRIWYWLVQQANPIPGGDPDAIPPMKDLRAAAMQAADAYLAAVTQRLQRGTA
jgi:hypothetical protein